MAQSRPLVYDTGALIGLARGDRAAWALHTAVLARHVAPIVPAPVLAQAWRGGPRQTLLARALAGCELVALTAAVAYEVGVLLAVARTADIVDATVVLAATMRGAAVLTSDPGDLSHLADAHGSKIPMHAI